MVNGRTWDSRKKTTSGGVRRHQAPTDKGDKGGHSTTGRHRGLQGRASVRVRTSQKPLKATETPDILGGGSEITAATLTVMIMSPLRGKRSIWRHYHPPRLTKPTKCQTLYFEGELRFQCTALTSSVYTVEISFHLHKRKRKLTCLDNNLDQFLPSVPTWRLQKTLQTLYVLRFLFLLLQLLESLPACHPCTPAPHGSGGWCDKERKMPQLTFSRTWSLNLHSTRCYIYPSKQFFIDTLESRSETGESS